MVKLETVETKASNLDIEVSKHLHSQCIKHRRSPEKLLREDNMGENRRVKEMGSLREYGKKEDWKQNSQGVKRNKTNLTTLLKMFLK